MDIMEMLRSGELSLMAVIVPHLIIVEAIAVGTFCLILAKSKNRNKVTALLIGVVPFFNILALLYYVETKGVIY
ncbi:MULTISPECIES: hypothetical protein [Pseudoalteromonas]|jgi:hypothetical protein|uniref:Cardiolipin synthase N-terminal domain-containing protein n=1 Tax=Pseudoalteromonas tetraodonis TaxID=43659 RepID=A0ABD4EL76_9GAMM|nr:MULTISPECIES: hypothetical protein [Pseudoalteromonas]KYL33649.1 hypothetical protein A2I96_03055 [Pseudoalteromonas spiralis]MDN3401507.1 hypothetical protein [Pseudoalteromonas sp. APC 3213]MDN3407240.1 hypothetical protein [Pseudoalteromonas sp. APC 3218]MDN3431472.1 hypothetical protein [Pseudoalteromonas sp. APC 3907]MDN3465558.1 hypothetical protein [Pseudoalteromonas sp. APC 3495]|tara:strand:+ start:1787 stop:2008 length:222 start_codon:yes stop_codon:yes gene_type:complete